MLLSDFSLWKIIFVCIGVFTASLVDAVAGGGGIISLPVYLISGLPAHMAIGTNKLSSCIGTSVSTMRYIKNGFVDWKLAIPSVLVALPGAYLGAELQLMVDENLLKYFLIVILPFVAFMVLRQKSFPEERQEVNPSFQKAVVFGFSFLISIYDGFYGPGTGTFLLLAFCNLGKIDIRTASGNMKIVNFTSNISALAAIFFAGEVLIPLGLIASLFSIAGHYVGSGLTIKNGSKVVRPVIILVLLLLTIKVAVEVFSNIG